MNETIASPLAAWASFYVIVGSSAAALTGLQFVVMTLIAENQSSRSRAESISAFGTPNVVHFCAALLVASLLSVPWSTLRPAGVAITACGVLGVIYSVIVLRRAIRQGDYEPVLEDWLWHTLLPALAYGTMLVAGLALGRNIADALFYIGAAALLLVFIGIHNAWDTVTYLMARPGTAPQAAVAGGVRPATPPAEGPGAQSGNQA